MKKIIICLLGALTTLIVISTTSCSTTQKGTKTRCPIDTTIFYQPLQQTLTIPLEEHCFVDKVITQTIQRIENDVPVGTISDKTHVYYLKQAIKLGISGDALKGYQETKIFKESKNKDFKDLGQIGASIEAKFQPAKEEEKDKLSYAFTAVFTTTMRNKESFKGELYAFKSLLTYKDVIETSQSMYGTQSLRGQQIHVPTSYVPSASNYAYFCLHSEEIQLRRIITDNNDYYQEEMIFNGEYNLLKETKKVRQATNIAGLNLAGPVSEVPVYKKVNWTLHYTKTDATEETIITEDGNTPNGKLLRGRYLYNSAKDILFEDNDGNGWDFVVYKGVRTPFEESGSIIKAVFQKHN